MVMIEPVSAFVTTVSLGVESVSLFRMYSGDRSGGNVVEIGTVKDFWQRHRSDELELGMNVSLLGSLSEFAPMLFGDPREVKERHFELREKLTGEDPSLVDPLISISSGNPIIRLPPINGINYVGLYDSIGRNSVPVFLDGSVFEEWKQTEADESMTVWDVEIRGRLGEIPDEWSDFFSSFGYDSDVAEFALYVDDHEKAGIEYIGETRFFEADAWAAYIVDGESRWLSRCPDFADRTDYRKTMENMIGILEDEESPEVISQYDLVDHPLTKVSTIQSNTTTVEEIQNKRLREEYVDRIQMILEA